MQIEAVLHTGLPLQVVGRIRAADTPCEVAEEARQLTSLTDPTIIKVQIRAGRIANLLMQHISSRAGFASGLLSNAARAGVLALAAQPDSRARERHTIL